MVVAETGLKEKIRHLEFFTENLFQNLEDTNLLTLEFRLLDQVGEKISQFCGPPYTGCFSFKNFNYIIVTCTRIESVGCGGILGGGCERSKDVRWEWTETPHEYKMEIFESGKTENSRTFDARVGMCLCYKNIDFKST